MLIAHKDAKKLNSIQKLAIFSIFFS